MPADDVLAYVRSRPTGKYARRLWFLYEFLTDRTLPLNDLRQGNYVDLLGPEAYYTVGSPRRVRRQRVNDNLLGDRRFCPTVRRTAVPDPQPPRPPRLHPGRGHGARFRDHGEEPRGLRCVPGGVRRPGDAAGGLHGRRRRTPPRAQRHRGLVPLHGHDRTGGGPVPLHRPDPRYGARRRAGVPDPATTRPERRSSGSWTCPTARSTSSSASASRTTAASPPANAPVDSPVCRTRRSRRWNEPCRPPGMPAGDPQRRRRTRGLIDAPGSRQPLQHPRRAIRRIEVPGILQTPCRPTRAAVPADGRVRCDSPHLAQDVLANLGQHGPFSARQR